jgi:hypothetical protein
VEVSSNANEEAKSLPRKDNFAVAVDAANTINAQVVATDYELDELIGTVLQSMMPQGWFSFGIVTLAKKQSWFTTTRSHSLQKGGELC